MWARRWAWGEKAFSWWRRRSEQTSDAFLTMVAVAEAHAVGIHGSWRLANCGFEKRHWSLALGRHARDDPVSVPAAMQQQMILLEHVTPNEIPALAQSRT